MSKFLLIETATDTCSAAISEGDNILVSKLLEEPKSQASKLAPMIQDCLNEAGIALNDCSAVAVSKGPGSYTGLRVGVSTAKGLCFGAGIPLIGIDTLEIIAREAAKTVQTGEGTIIIPMIDARRMEVYTAVYDHTFKPLSETAPKILDENSFAEEMEMASAVIFAGNGAAKFESCLNGKYKDKCVFVPCPPTAASMAVPALDAWNRKRLEDVAYFEPFYLKDFVAGISKKSML